MTQVDGRDDGGSSRLPKQGTRSPGDHRTDIIRRLNMHGTCTLYDALPGISDRVTPSLKRTLQVVSLCVATSEDTMRYQKQGRKIEPGQVFLLCACCDEDPRNRCSFPRSIKHMYVGLNAIINGHLKTCDRFQSGADEAFFKRSAASLAEWDRYLRKILVDGRAVQVKPLLSQNSAATVAPLNGEDSVRDAENALPRSESNVVSCSIANLAFEDLLGHVKSSRLSGGRRRSQRRPSGSRSCAVCLQGELSFLPPKVYCTKCSKKVARNRMYYSLDAYVCCVECYKKLSGDTFVNDGIKRDDLIETKNNAKPKEGWKQCGARGCNRWVHESCGLFNPNEKLKGPYHCPLCLTEERNEFKKASPSPTFFPCAKAIPQTALSRWLEQRILLVFQAKVNRLVEEEAHKMVSL